MGLDYGSVHEEKVKYFVTYKSKLNGSMGIVTTTAVSKSDVERLFNDKLQNYEIFKTRDLYELIEDFGKETTNNLIKHLKTIDSLFEGK
jgi:hypothetical protein